MPNEQLPNDANGLQLNFCKTLACDNFGLSEAKYYILQHTNPKRPTMVCRECGAFPPSIHNQEVLNEFQRLKEHQYHGLPACHNKQCKHFCLSVHTHKHFYHSFGYSGERQRYRCKSCGITFVDKYSGMNKKNECQELLLQRLFEHRSAREICDELSIHLKTFYDHIDQIAHRCRYLLSIMDARWAHLDSNDHCNEDVSLTTHYEFASNYMPLQPVSHNGVLWFVTGEARSGYIVCQDINYTINEQPQGTIEHDPYAFPARFVSPQFIPEANVPSSSEPLMLRARIEQCYQTILARNNVEDPMSNFTQFHYPVNGALIRPQYTSYAHFLQLLSLCPKDKHLSIYMPQDPLLRSAALSVSLSRIQQKTIDLMYVQEDEQWHHSSNINKIDIAYVGWWRDRWAISNINGSEKGICYFAGNTPSPEQWLIKASIKPVLNYQQQFQHQFSRFINEPTRKRRPAGLLPLLDIFRAWYNLCHHDDKGRTPANYLGLTSSHFYLNDLLYVKSHEI